MGQPGFPFLPRLPPPPPPPSSLFFLPSGPTDDLACLHFAHPAPTPSFSSLHHPQALGARSDTYPAMAAVGNAFRTWLPPSSSSSSSSSSRSPRGCAVWVAAGAGESRIVTRPVPIRHRSSTMPKRVRLHSGSGDRSSRCTAPATGATIPEEFVWPAGSRPEPALALHHRYEAEGGDAYGEAPVVDVGVVSRLAELQGQLAQLEGNKLKPGGASLRVVAMAADKEAAMRREVARLQQQRQEAVGAVRRGMLHFGFFQMVNHALPRDLIYNLSHTAQLFFQRSHQDKAKAVLSAEGEGGFGYNGLWTTMSPAMSSVPRVWQEVVTLACPAGGGVMGSPDMVDCLAPLLAEAGHAPWVNSVVKRYTAAAEGVAAAALELIAESLGLAGHLMAEEEEEPVRVVRLEHAPACPRPDLTWASSARTHQAALALVHQDLAGGLEFRTRAGAWLGVRPVPDALIVSAGDLLQAWTNDRVWSAQQRAVTSSDRNRLSMAVSYLPPPETVIVPAPELVDRAHPALYRRFTVAQFAEAAKTQQAGNTLLDHFRLHPRPLDLPA